VRGASGALVWDSGWVALGGQSHVPYGGPELEPGASYVTRGVLSGASKG
jgi:hypothetical protein